MKDTFVSGFAPDLENMIALKRALGYSENTYLVGQQILVTTNSTLLYLKN